MLAFDKGVIALYIASKIVRNVKMTFGPLLVVFDEASETTIRIAS